MATDIRPPRQLNGLSKLCLSCLEKCSALCLRKEDIQPLDIERWIVINDYNYKPGSLVPGKSQGCVLCTILSQLGNDEDWIQAKWSIHYLPRAACDPLGLVDFDQLHIDFYESKPDAARSKVFDVRASAANPASKYISSREFDLDLASHANISLAQTWLKNCSSSHKACIPKVSNLLVPTRVLDIGPSHSNEVRLHITSPDKPIPYAALSYCWGGAKFETLTLDTLEAKKNRIELSTLAATIKDTISLARNLGLTYLWVDSLCIIQDSKKDRDLELPKMSSIYGNSTLTIIAAAAVTPLKGFLKPNSAPPKVDLRLPFGAPGLKTCSIILRDKNALDDVDNKLDPTETRAWCLQEALLSPRCLVASSLRFYWGCQEVAYADHDLQHSRLPAPEHIHHFVQNLPPLFSSIRNQESLTTENWDELWNFWVDVLADYTYRDMGKLPDRFKALSGIAMEFNAVTGDTYYAGLWKHDIWKGLLWAVDFSSMLGQHSHYWRQLPFKTSLTSRPILPADVEYLAPTWSWASVLGHVYHYPSEKSRFFEFVSADIEHEDEKFPFGALRGAAMKVKGRLEHAIWTKEVLASGGGHHWLTCIDHGTMGGVAPSRINHAWSHTVLKHILSGQASDRPPNSSVARPVNLPSFGIGNSWFPPGSPWRDFCEQRPNVPSFNRGNQGFSRGPQWGAPPSHGFSSFPPSAFGSADQSFSVDTPLPREARAYSDTWEGWAYENDWKIEEVYCLEVGNGTGLILKPVPEHRGTFRRVGFFLAESNRWFATSPVEDITLV